MKAEYSAAQHSRREQSRRNMKLENLDFSCVKIGETAYSQEKAILDPIHRFHFIFSCGEFDIDL